MTSFYDDFAAADYDVTTRETDRGGPRFDRSSSARYATKARYGRRRGKASSANGAHRRRNKRSGV